MLTLALPILFTLIGAVAVISIADSAMKARAAYEHLMCEAALMRAGFAVQVKPQALRVRRAERRVMQDRRLAGSRMQPAPACAAA